MSECTTEMTTFICVDIWKHVWDGFRILHLVSGVVRLFGYKLKLSRIVMVPQESHRLRLIINLSEKPNEGTPIFNNTADREFAPESMQFGLAFPPILQSIWKAYPDKRPVYV